MTTISLSCKKLWCIAIHWFTSIQIKFHYNEFLWVCLTKNKTTTKNNRSGSYERHTHSQNKMPTELKRKVKFDNKIFHRYCFRCFSLQHFHMLSIWITHIHYSFKHSEWRGLREMGKGSEQAIDRRIEKAREISRERMKEV